MTLSIQLVVAALLLLLVGDVAAQAFTCNNCTTGFGVKGTSKWCQCCALDCLSSLAACKSADGWCSTRCLTNNPPVCPTTTTTALPTPAPTPVPVSVVRRRRRRRRRVCGAR